MALFHHVEDKKEICQLFSQIMALFGHEILSFGNGLKYLDYMSSSEYICPIAIFTDIDMPVMNGYEMIGNVIERYPNRLIVVHSANADKSNVNERHVFRHLDKPFPPEELEVLAKTLIIRKLSLGLTADVLNDR